MGMFRVEIEIGDAVGERWLLGAYTVADLWFVFNPIGGRLVFVPGLLMEFAV